MGTFAKSILVLFLGVLAIFEIAIVHAGLGQQDGHK
jgi:hypothetical protein